MIILKLREGDYSVVSSILVMAQGLELNIRREEIIKSSQMKREEERISFLSSHNLYWIVKGRKDENKDTFSMHNLFK